MNKMLSHLAFESLKSRFLIFFRNVVIRSSYHLLSGGAQSLDLACGLLRQLERYWNTTLSSNVSITIIMMSNRRIFAVNQAIVTGSMKFDQLQDAIADRPLVLVGVLTLFAKQLK